MFQVQGSMTFKNAGCYWICCHYIHAFFLSSYIVLSFSPTAAWFTCL